MVLEDFCKTISGYFVISVLFILPSPRQFLNGLELRPLSATFAEVTVLAEDLNDGFAEVDVCFHLKALGLQFLPPVQEQFEQVDEFSLHRLCCLGAGDHQSLLELLVVGQIGFG